MSISIQTPDADAPPPEADLRTRLQLAINRAVDGILDKSDAVALHAGGGPLRLFERRVLTGHWPGKFAEGASVVPPDDVLAAAGALYAMAMARDSSALLGAVSVANPRYAALLARYRVALLIALSAGYSPPAIERKKVSRAGLQLVETDEPAPPSTAPKPVLALPAPQQPQPVRKKRTLSAEGLERARAAASKAREARREKREGMLPDRLPSRDQQSATTKRALAAATVEELRALRPRVSPYFQARIDTVLAERSAPPTRKEEPPRHTYPTSRYNGGSD